MIQAPKEVVKRSKKWYKSCGYCGVEQSYTRKRYAIYSFLLNKRCRACTAKVNNTKPHYIYEQLKLSWFYKFKTGAETRGIKWQIEVKDIWELYIKQGKICSLSGVPIGWEEIGRHHTASIDRIDSTKGYTLGNIQLVHKDINIMKSKYPQDYFISMCHLVAKSNKD
jgi:hypothetical protein